MSRLHERPQTIETRGRVILSKRKQEKREKKKEEKKVDEDAARKKEKEKRREKVARNEGERERSCLKVVRLVH